MGTVGVRIASDGVYFRIWAPTVKKIELIIDGQTYNLKAEDEGYYSTFVSRIGAGTLYRYRIDDEHEVPDPVSQYQPEGPFGPSQIINQRNFNWTDQNWLGILNKESLIIYEMHIGTFTEEGTWRAAKDKLAHLVDLGITTIEIMPIAECPGSFNWGYDGVNLYAPNHNYGHPDDVKAFINEAHHLGLGVVLDVVYNHLGPAGNYLSLFSKHYFKKENNEWGQAINFDDRHSGPVREFFINNAGYWIEEFHFDGLRFDACHSIIDTSPSHILLEMTKKVREKGDKRITYVTAENEKQEVHFVLPEEKGGFAMDAIWNEDFHHASFVKLTGNRKAYFSDYIGKAREFASTYKYNFLYQGQWYSWKKQPRGTDSMGIKPHHFINFLENHDQVANTGTTQRLPLISHIKAYKAMTALLLLAPQTPLLFQGQEFGSSAPFFYFCDHEKDLGEKVYKGRLEFISQFKNLDLEDLQEEIPNPCDKSTFEKSKISWKDQKKNKSIYALYKDLIALRRNDGVFSHPSEISIGTVVFDDNFFVIRYFSPRGERLLVFNLDMDYIIDPPSDPLLAPPPQHLWSVIWSTEMPRYGGCGFPEINREQRWRIPGFSACILIPELRP